MQKIYIFFSLVISLYYPAQRFRWLPLRHYRVAYLGDALKESSGLNLQDGKLYTFNDSGNTSEIFELSKANGRILSTLKTGLRNEDWEALASDSENFYIGDFGNNLGTRRDLKIYRYNLKTGLSQEFPFYYPEQIDFSPRNIRHNYDGESLVFLGEKLHIFTKEWASKCVTHYTVSLDSTHVQAAKKMEDYPLGFVATDASYYNKKLYLVGYTKKAEVYLKVFDETTPGMFFKSEPKKFYLGSAVSLGQVEGIAVDSDGIYISAEEFNLKIFHAPQSFYFIPMKDFENKLSN